MLKDDKYHTSAILKDKKEFGMKKILLSLIVCLAFVCFSCPQMAEASDEGTATSQVDTSSQVGKKHPNARENRANASHKKMKGKKKSY